MNKLLSAIALTLLVQLPALASDFYDNPWKLRSPVIIKPASHAKLYKHVVFTGWMDDLEDYVKYHELKPKYSQTGACNHGKSGVMHEVVCVAVDGKGRPLDPTIFQVKHSNY